MSQRPEERNLPLPLKYLLIPVLSLFLAFSFVTDSDARPRRSAKQRAEFVRMNPCPATGKTRGACPGWNVDHIIPLKCSGAVSTLFGKAVADTNKIIGDLRKKTESEMMRLSEAVNLRWADLSRFGELKTKSLDLEKTVREARA